MSVMDIFRSILPASPTPGAPQPPAGPSMVAQPGVALPGTQQTEQTAANGLVPTQTNETPFEAFKDIWQTPANTPADSDGAMFKGVDPQTLMASAGKVDFARVITPEQLTAITAGGQGAVEALASAMNKVAQSVYAQSAYATTKIVDQALVQQQTNFDARLPNMVKRLSVNENLQTTNPLLSNPALVPLVSALNEQLVRKNPNATSTEIQQQVNDYFSAIGTAFAPKAPETSMTRAAKKAAASEDWDKFMS